MTRKIVLVSDLSSLDASGDPRGMGSKPVYTASAMNLLVYCGSQWRTRSDARERLRALGYDHDGPFVTYPQPVWDQAVRILAEENFPDLPLTEALFKVGKFYISTLLGTHAFYFAMESARLSGPEQALQSIYRADQTTNNFTRIELERFDATHYRIQVSVDPLWAVRMEDRLGADRLHFLRGVYFGMIKTVSVRNPGVEARAIDPTRIAYSFDLHWDPGGQRDTEPFDELDREFAALDHFE